LQGFGPGEVNKVAKEIGGEVDNGAKQSGGEEGKKAMEKAFEEKNDQGIKVGGHTLS
jgi:hypothetical protein